MGNIASVTGPRGSSSSVRSSYAYDALNQLTSETNGSETYTYTYDTAGNIQTVTDPNGKVIREYWTQNGTEYILDFFYDVNGKPLALYYRVNGASTAYYYQTNLQGDVMKIFKVTSSGGVATATQVASYAYDAWGNEINISRYAHTGIPGFQL